MTTVWKSSNTNPLDPTPWYATAAANTTAATASRGNARRARSDVRHAVFIRPPSLPPKCKPASSCSRLLGEPGSTSVGPAVQSHQHPAQRPPRLIIGRVDRHDAAESFGRRVETPPLFFSPHPPPPPPPPPPPDSGGGRTARPGGIVRARRFETPLLFEEPHPRARLRF